MNEYGLNKARISALSSRNAQNYAQYCIDSGINPEDPFLFEVGLADIAFAEKKESKIMARSHYSPAKRPVFPEKGGNITRELRARVRLARQGVFD